MNRLALILAALLLVGCSSSSSIVTGHIRPPYDDEKVIVYMAPPLRKYEVIGMVTAEASRGWTAQGHMDSAVRNIKEEAAKLGANGIILGGAGTVAGPGMALATSSSTAIMVPTTEPTVTGTAIWVEENTDSERAVPTVTQVAPASQYDLHDEILKLDDLRKKGLITDAEFEGQKQKLLNRAK